MTAPLDEKDIVVGMRVEKFTGEARWHGVVVSEYQTTRGMRRFVVDVEPQGFQMIAVPSQLRPALAASPSPSEMEVVPSDLVERLRATRKAISYGVDAVEVDVAPSMLDLEAADAIELTQSALAAMRAERNRWEQRFFKMDRNFDRAVARAETAESQVLRLTEENEALRELAERLKLEAQGHASEARTANSTIYEIYQVLSGGKGEPGNWHGAEPARRYVEAAEARIKALEEALERIGELNMTAEDENGHRWANSDLINQEIVAARAFSTESQSK